MVVPDSKVLRDLQAKHSSLSPQLRKAAQFVIDNPEEIALHSMRAIAAQAQVHPNVLLRLAREIGFESYATFRNHFQSWIVSKGTISWEERAQDLRQRFTPEQDYITALQDQELANLRKTFDLNTGNKLQEAAEAINNSRRAFVLGLRSLFTASYHFHYLCRLFTEKTILLTGIGGTGADVLRNITEQDVLVAFTHKPYAVETLKFVNFSRAQGARTIIITDSKVSPTLDKNSINIVVSNTTQSLLPTLVPAIAVAQTLATILLTSGSDETVAEIRRSEHQLKEFGIYLK